MSEKDEGFSVEPDEELAREQVRTIMDFLSSCRKQHDITQEEMGEALGVGQRTISQLENAENPGLKRVAEYAEVLGFGLTPVLKDLTQGRDYDEPFVERG